MDFIKNLHISDIAADKGKDNKHPADSIPPAPPPTAVHATQSGAASSSSIFDKIGDALKDAAQHKTGGAPMPAPTAAAAPATVQTQSSTKEDIFSKLGDALSGRKTPPPIAVAAPTPIASGRKGGDGHGENLFSKLGDALSGKKTPPPPPPPVEKHHNLVDKLTEVVTGKKAEPVPVPAAKPSFAHSISNAVLGGGRGEEKVVQQPQGLMDKLNHALGGGAKGEAEEDKLDKAIDLFQEHILKEGPQNNESALEQAKDKHIADMIKSAVGVQKKDK